MENPGSFICVASILDFFFCNLTGLDIFLFLMSEHQKQKREIRKLILNQEINHN